VVPFNIRLNDVMDLIDDWIERCAAGMTIYDSNKIDRREMAGRVMSPGVLNGVQTKGAGIDKPLQDAIMQFKFDLDPQVFNYPPMLIQMAETISGVTPQTFGGGGQEGIETKGGQEQALNTALGKLNIYWKGTKGEHAQAAQNALECLQKLMQAGAVGEIWDVVQANGSEFRNNYVNWNKMQGHIKVYQDIDQGLPQTPQQIRETMQTFLKMSDGKNPIVTSMLDCVPNQESMMATLAPPGWVLPQAAQRPTDGPAGQPVACHAGAGSRGLRHAPRHDAAILAGERGLQEVEPWRVGADKGLLRHGYSDGSGRSRRRGKKANGSEGRRNATGTAA
jgi:hypothetical protein